MVEWGFKVETSKRLVPTYQILTLRILYKLHDMFVYVSNMFVLYDVFEGRSVKSLKTPSNCNNMVEFIMKFNPNCTTSI